MDIIIGFIKKGCLVSRSGVMVTTQQVLKLSRSKKNAKNSIVLKIIRQNFVGFITTRFPSLTHLATLCELRSCLSNVQSHILVFH